MGISTISMANFNSYVSHYQRVCFINKNMTWPVEGCDLANPKNASFQGAKNCWLRNLGFIRAYVGYNCMYIMCIYIYCIWSWSSEVDRIWTFQCKSPLKWEHLNELFYLLQDNYVYIYIYTLWIPWSGSIRGSRTFLEGIWIHREVCNYMLKYKIIFYILIWVKIEQCAWNNHN